MEICERFSQAREIQQKRFKSSRGTKTNAAMGARHVREHCALDAEGQGFLEQAKEDQHFSARPHGRILKVARTIADLAGEEEIGATHVLEAIQFRSLDRKLFQ